MLTIWYTTASSNKTFISLGNNGSEMTSTDLPSLVSELLNKDRLDYLEIIASSEDGAGSFQVTKEILRSRNTTRKKEARRENMIVSKRLGKLVALGILIPVEVGKYRISSLGYLLLRSWKDLKMNAESLTKFREFFDTQYISALPDEFFREIYKLEKAAVTENPIQWENEVREYMKRIENKFYNLTEYIHDFPNDVIEKKRRGEIEIVIIYQFKKYPELNYSDEKKELLSELARAGADLRYMTLEKNRHPIGVRIVDDKWATLGFTRIGEWHLDRAHSLISSDLEFISWCRDLMYHMWHFEAKPLDVEKVIEHRGGSSYR
jgi:predicted transcriptional regulator